MFREGLLAGRLQTAVNVHVNGELQMRRRLEDRDGCRFTEPHWRHMWPHSAQRRTACNPAALFPLMASALDEEASQNVLQGLQYIFNPSLLTSQILLTGEPQSPPYQGAGVGAAGKPACHQARPATASTTAAAAPSSANSLH